jgi:hypothetical protein
MRSLGTSYKIPAAICPEENFTEKYVLRNLFALLVCGGRSSKKILFIVFRIGVMRRVKNPPVAVAENPSTPNSRNPGDDLLSVCLNLSWCEHQIYLFTLLQLVTLDYGQRSACSSGIQHFRCFLAGRKLTTFTDHKPLT